MLAVNDLDIVFSDINVAKEILADEYGYEGLAWNLVTDMKDLRSFLSEDGLDVVLVDQVEG